MSEQARVSKSKSEAKRVAELEKVETKKSEDAEQIKTDIDDFLDEIDEVLDTEFDVSQYVQKGGE